MDIQRKIGFRQLDHIHHAFGNVHRLVAHAFQIRIDLGHGKNEPQIDCHGLLHGQQIERHLVNLALDQIDLRLTLKHHVAALEIALNICLASAVDRLFSQPAHAKQTCPKIVQFLMKSAAHYPNLPVM